MPYICICYKVKVWTNGIVRLRPSPQQLCRFQTQNFAKSPTSYRVQTPTNTLLCIGYKHQILTNSLIHLGGNLLIFTNAILFIDSNYQILKILFWFFLFLFFFFFFFAAKLRRDISISKKHLKSCRKNRMFLKTFKIEIINIFLKRKRGARALV